MTMIFTYPLTQGKALWNNKNNKKTDDDDKDKDDDDESSKKQQDNDPVKVHRILCSS